MLLLHNIIYSIIKVMNHSISTMAGKTKVKIVFLGCQAVGKSSIIQKYIHNRFDEASNPTVGIDFLAKNISHKAKNYRLQLWDTAGQQRFRSLIPSYLKDANCALIVFDVTSKRSFEELEMWITLFNQNKVGDGFIFILGNKIDLEFRQVTEAQAKQYCQKIKIPYFQTSAKTGENVEQLFLRLVEHSTEKPATDAVVKIVKQEKDVIQQETPKQQQQKQQNEKELPVEVKQQQNKDKNVKEKEVQVNDKVKLTNEKIEGRKKEKHKKCC